MVVVVPAVVVVVLVVVALPRPLLPTAAGLKRPLRLPLLLLRAIPGSFPPTPP